MVLPELSSSLNRSGLLWFMAIDLSSLFVSVAYASHENPPILLATCVCLPVLRAKLHAPGHVTVITCTHVNPELNWKGSAELKKLLRLISMQHVTNYASQNLVRQAYPCTY